MAVKEISSDMYARLIGQGKVSGAFDTAAGAKGRQSRVGGEIYKLHYPAVTKKVSAGHNRPAATYWVVVTDSTKNPQATKFPKGKFVKVQAIRVNRDGTVTVKK